MHSIHYNILNANKMSEKKSLCIIFIFIWGCYLWTGVYSNDVAISVTSMYAVGVACTIVWIQIDFLYIWACEGKWVGKPCVPWEGWVYMWCSDADYSLAMCVALHFCEECHGLHEGFFSLQLLVWCGIHTPMSSVVDSMLVAMQGIVYLMHAS